MRNEVSRWIGNFFQPPKTERLNLGRRRMLMAGILGVSGRLVVGTNPLADSKSFNPKLIRPPGAVSEREFLQRCIRCGECMKVCPTNAIQPTLFEGGFEGMFSPALNMRIGYCEYECTLCSQSCPTHAIRKIDLEGKQKIKIGLAYIDKNRCLPYAYARTCIVCEEHCPTPTKAIWFEEVSVEKMRGERVLVKQPHVDPDLCIGCGICEAKCPVADQAAVSVMSVGESRNPKNQIFLEDQSFIG